MKEVEERVKWKAKVEERERERDGETWWYWALNALWNLTLFSEGYVGQYISILYFSLFELGICHPQVREW